MLTRPSKLKILVTAGPTWEPIDVMRYLGNRSTGKMGFAVAEAAVMGGHDTRLIAGPVSLATPRGVDRIDVETAQQMYDAVRGHFAWCEVLVMTAAVADWRPAERIAGKLKKHDGERHLHLVRTPDILRTVGSDKGGKYLVGFAAEAEDLEENAARKLREKNLDLIVANPVMQADAAFGADTNRVVMLSRDGRRVALPLLSKQDVAHHILEQVESDVEASKP